MKGFRCYFLIHAFGKSTERVNFHSKQQISKLGVGEEDDEEHDGEAHDVFSASPQSGGQLSHGLIKTDVLENLMEKRHGHGQPDRLDEDQRPDPHSTLIQAKNRFTAFMLLYCICQKARNSKSA